MVTESSPAGVKENLSPAVEVTVLLTVIFVIGEFVVVTTVVPAGISSPVILLPTTMFPSGVLIFIDVPLTKAPV